MNGKSGSTLTYLKPIIHGKRVKTARAQARSFNAGNDDLKGLR